MGFISAIKETLSRHKDSGAYLSGFKKTSSIFRSHSKELSKNFKGVNDEFLEDLTVMLLEADVGIETADEICHRLVGKVEEKFFITFNSTMDMLFEIMADIYNESSIAPLKFNDDGLTVILLVGVNGSGKTTTAAKLCHRYQQENKKIMLVAADTFRAGAVDQLLTWGERLHAPCYAGKDKEDPSSVIMDGISKAKADGMDIVICDTAGRLQTKINLMNELNKMSRVVEKACGHKADQTLLVLDATTGQNGLSQAELFNETTSLDGIILTKMDGTAKGGIVLPIKHKLDLPVYYIGLGEGMDDLKPFDLNDYLASLAMEMYDVY